MNATCVVFDAGATLPIYQGLRDGLVTGGCRDQMVTASAHRISPEGSGGMVELIRGYDWSRTSLGEIDRWPQALRTAVDLMLAAEQPVHIGWGADLISLYNDAFIPIVGAHHPSALGQPAKCLWPNAWDTVRPVIDGVMGGESRRTIDHQVSPPGHHDQPRNWFTFSWAPLRNDEGRVQGYYCTATEPSERFLTDRALDAGYRSLFETIEEGFCICERLPVDPVDFRYLAANPAFERHSGLAHPVGKTIRELVPAVEDDIMARYDRVATTGHPESFVSHVAGLDRWLDIVVTPVAPPGRIAVLFRDVSARMLAERAARATQERQAFLLALGDELSGLTDPDEIIAVVGRQLGAFLTLGGCLIADIDDHNDAMVVVHRWNRDGGFPPGQPVSYRIHDYATEAFVRASRAGETVVVRNTATDGRVDAKAYACLRIGAWLTVPFHRGAEWVAFLSVTDPAPRDWTQDDIDLVREVAERTFPRIERARAEAARKDSENRFRQFGEASSDVLWIVDAATGRVEYLSPAFEQMWGIPAAKVMADMSVWEASLHPDDRERVLQALPRVLAGERVEQEFRIIRADGATRYVADVGFPIFDGNRRVVRAGGIVQDLTGRHEVESAVRDSERFSRALVEGVPQLVWRAVGAGDWTWASPQWSDYTGQAEPDSHGWGWLDPVHPDDRDDVRQIWAGAIERGEFHADYRICHAIEHRYRWFQTRATPVRDDEGRIVEWLGTSTDVDDLRRLQDRQRTLVAELQHRVRNILTVVRSVFGRTVEAGGDVAHVADHFRGRLDSLARTQVVVTQSAAGGVDLADLIRDELLSVGEHEGARVRLDGPDLTLDAKTAESIGLAIHELTTNAVKYGALSQAGATISIHWEIKADYGRNRRLALIWHEQGMPVMPLRPSRRGFGSELIEEALPYQLGAETSLEFRGGGVRCSLTMPLPSGNVPIEIQEPA